MELVQGRFEGRTQFAQCVRDALAVAAQQGWSELVLSDPDFADWPLGERAVVDALQAWARPGRRFVMLAASYDELTRRHARFVQWRVHWSHLVACHACRAPDASAIPSLIWSADWSLRRLDAVHNTGWAGAEARRRTQSRELIDQWIQRATPAFPAAVLGL